MRIAAHRQPAVVDALVAEAADLDGDALGQRAGEIFDMHAGPAVNVGRVFLAEERDLFGKGHLVRSRFGKHKA